MARIKVFAFSLCIVYALLLPAQDPSKIEIIRDQWGVPHIYSPTDAGVAYGLAWAHSEDDFNTIQLTMLGAKQMLGKHLGKTGATVDYVVGLLRCEEIVRANIEKVTPEFMAIVKGYANGLNAYARHHPEEVHLKKAFPVNEIDIFKAYVLQLAVMDGADKTISDLFENKTPSISSQIKGSNAIAISKNRTADEYSYLAINSHQPLEGSAAWYEAHLVSDEGWNMLGGLFPGGPVVFHGTNENLGWAHTVNYPDKVDVFQLEINPDNKNQYWIDDEWLSLESEKIKLRVKTPLGFSIPIKKKAYYSIYGPVVKNASGSFAFHMSVFDEIRAIEQWYEMNKSTNFEEFKEALKDIRIPSFNIVYADKESNIFYISNGLLPKRDPAYNWASTLPGNTSKTTRNGYHSFADLPQITNPTSGYLFNMNNSPFNATSAKENLKFSSYDPTMGFVERENNRSTRMDELMKANQGMIDWETFWKIKFDSRLPDSLVYQIDINPLFKMSPTASKEANEILSIIQGWDKVATADREGPAHLLLIYEYLQENEYFTPNKQEFEKALTYCYTYLKKHFESVSITLGDFQKLVRGSNELPLGGIPDVITAMYSQPFQNGKVKGLSGESYIMMIKYPENGLPIIETINVFGSSNRSDSPHYADQMELFTNKKLKKMSLDIDEVRKNSQRIYHPK